MARQITIPKNNYNFVQSISVAGATYQLDLRYVKRTESWVLGLYLSDGSPVVTGVKVVPNVQLLSKLSLSNFSGDFVCLRLRGVTEPLTSKNLGVNKEYTLVYFAEEEL